MLDDCVIDRGDFTTRASRDPESSLTASLYRLQADDDISELQPRNGTVIDAAETGRAPHPLRVLARVGPFCRRHPEWWVVAGSAAAWGAMIILPHPAAAHHGHAPAAGQSTLATALMIVAMMLPLAIPSIRHAAGSGWRPHRGIAAFLAGYLAVWMIAMLVIAAAWELAAALTGWTAAAVGAVAAAALGEVAPLRQRLVGRCHRAPPLAPDGWRADADCSRYGATSGVACVGMCWALMAVCVAFAHSLPVMIALFAVQLSGRYRPRPTPAVSAAAVLGTGLIAIAARITGGYGA
jgi:predicted metal-binding membrane protein